MTGPDHYREAERWAGMADMWWKKENDKAPVAAAAAAIGQLHATLALTAAPAIPIACEMPIPDCDAWREVASVVEAGSPS